MSHRKRAEEADEPCGSAAVGQQNACKEAWHTCKLCGDRRILRDKYWIAGERPRSYQAVFFNMTSKKLDHVKKHGQGLSLYETVAIDKTKEYLEWTRACK